MEIQKPFIPRRGGGQTVSSVPVTSTSITIGAGSDVLVFTSPSSNTGIVYVAIGPVGVTATTADYPIIPGSQVSIGKFLDDGTVALVCPTGSADIHVIGGIGV